MRRKVHQVVPFDYLLMAHIFPLIIRIFIHRFTTLSTPPLRPILSRCTEELWGHRVHLELRLIERGLQKLSGSHCELRRETHSCCRHSGSTLPLGGRGSTWERWGFEVLKGSSRVSVHGSSSLREDAEGMSRTYCFPSLYTSSSFWSNVPSVSNLMYALYSRKADSASSMESCVSIWMSSFSTYHERNRSESRRWRALMKYKSTVSITCSGGTKISV